MLRNELIDTLLENATSFSERSEITSLTEAETYKVSNIMVANLYQSVLDKSYIDFDDIPRSKGDITHYSGYKNMISSISTIKDIATKSNKTRESFPPENAQTNAKPCFEYLSCCSCINRIAFCSRLTISLLLTS